MTLSSLLVTVCLVVPDLLAGKLRSKAGLTRCMGHGAPCITLRICRDTARWTWTTWRTWSMSPPCTFSDQRLCYGQPLAYNKNVWMLDKSWEPRMFSHTLTTLSHSHSHTLTLTLSHSLIHSFSTCWTTFVFMSMLKSDSLTLSHSLSLTHSLSHSLTLPLSHSHTHTLSLFDLGSTHCVIIKS